MSSSKSRFNLKLFFNCSNILISERQSLPIINNASSFASSNEIVSFAKSCVFPIPAFPSTTKNFLLSRLRSISGNTNQQNNSFRCFNFSIYIFNLVSLFLSRFLIFSYSFCASANFASISFISFSNAVEIISCHFSTSQMLSEFTSGIEITNSESLRAYLYMSSNFHRKEATSSMRFLFFSL